MDYHNIFPKILFSYLIKIYLKNILLVLLIFLFLIFLIDFIEIYRRASEKINFKNNDNFISFLYIDQSVEIRLKPYFNLLQTYSNLSNLLKT